MLKLLSNVPDENNLLSLSLDEIARIGAKKLLIQALELEVSEYIERNHSVLDSNNHRQVVRNGKAKERTIQTGAGSITVSAPRVNDKREGENFNSFILPRYLRKSPKIESLLPVLYLKGLSGNAFSDALTDLLGANAGGLSSSSIAAMKKQWIVEKKSWNSRLIEGKFAYVWADGVNLKIRLGEDKRLCMLVLIGVKEDGSKELLAAESGYRESKDSWKFVFNDLISRGFSAPLMVIADGALGLWAAIDEIDAFNETKHQRCWVHRIANVLDKLPKRLQGKGKEILHEIMRSPTKEDALKEATHFKKNFEDKYPKSVKCLKKDFNKLVAFFDFPAAHWQHIRTTNPIESSFSTVKLRTKSTKGAGNKEIAEAMAFKLLIESQKKWAVIKGNKLIPGILAGQKYKDGILIKSETERIAV